MALPTATRKFGIDCGHRVLGHGGKCRHLHGHRYTILVTMRAELDSLGMVLDFGDMKAAIGDWLDTNWDHGFLLHEDDTEAIAAVTQVKDQKVALLPCNPTAENIAQYLLETLQQLVSVPIVRVQVYETPNCSAIAEVDQ